MATYESAWEAIQAEIDDFLACQGSRAALVSSPSGTGKSTGLLLHVFHVSKARGVPVLYALANAEEAWDLHRHLTDSGVGGGVVLAEDVDTVRGQLDGDVLVLTSLPVLVPMKTIDRELVVLVDMEVRTSLRGELCLSRLMGLARDERMPPLAVLLLSTFHSPRTIAAFRRQGTPVVELDVTPNTPGPDVPVQDVAPEDWEARVHEALTTFTPHSRGATVVTRTTISLPPIEGLEGHRFGDSDFCSQNSFTLKDRQPMRQTLSPDVRFLLKIHTELDVVMARPGLELVLSDGTALSRVLDCKSTQVVTRERPLSLPELQREEAWVLRSAAPSDVLFLRRAVSDEAREHSYVNTFESLGPAWNADMSLLILQLAAMWTNVPVRKWPARLPQDSRQWAEVCRRLCACRCIEYTPGPDNQLRLLPRGEGVLRWLDLLPRVRPGEADFHCLCLAANTSEDPRVRIVLLLLSVIIHVGETDLATNTIPEPLGLDDAAAIDGVLGQPGLASRGWLWCVLGVLARADEEGLLKLVTPPAERTSVVLGMVLDICRAHRVLEVFRGLIQYPAGRDLCLANEVRLTHSQVAEVEWHLLMAYQHRCLLLHEDQSPVDVCSRRDMKYDDREPLDTEALQEEADDGAVFAVYLDLYEVHPASYVARCLTAISGDAVNRWRQTGWPERIVTGCLPYGRG